MVYAPRYCKLESHPCDFAYWWDPDRSSKFDRLMPRNTVAQTSLPDEGGFVRFLISGFFVTYNELGRERRRAHLWLTMVSFIVNLAPRMKLDKSI